MNGFILYAQTIMDFHLNFSLRYTLGAGDYGFLLGSIHPCHALGLLKMRRKMEAEIDALKREKKGSESLW